MCFILAMEAAGAAEGRAAIMLITSAPNSKPQGSASVLSKQAEPSGLLLGALNQSIKTQDQQCQWPNKPRPQTQGS